MAAPTIPNGEEYFFPIIYEGNGTGQRVGKFVPFTDSGTIDNSCIFNNVTSSAGHYLRKASMSAGNQQVATFSAWIKFTGPFSTSSDLFTNNGGILEQGNGSWTSGSHFMFYQTRGRLEFYHNGSAILRTSRYLQDSSKWYHIMFALDVTQAAAADRLKIYIDGNFESEKYFLDYRNDLLNQFSFKKDMSNNKYLDIIRKHNVVSISVRQNRYSERMSNKFDQYSISKSQDFVAKTVDYIYQSIKFIKSKVHNPKFLLWSNDFTGLEKYFPTNEFLYVINPDDKILNDFYLLTQCKYFIVGPSTFSWWGAWLSNNESKICIRPKTINPSNNLDFWPESWLSI